MHLKGAESGHPFSRLMQSVSILATQRLFKHRNGFDKGHPPYLVIGQLSILKAHDPSMHRISGLGHSDIGRHCS